MTVRKPLVIFNPLHKTARTIAELLTCIESALNADDWGIEPGSIDTHGMTIVADGISYRLELTDEERLYPSQDAYEQGRDLDDNPETDRDWQTDFGDDIAF